MKYEDLALIDCEQINYKELGDDLLEELIKKNELWDHSLFALTELSMRQSIRLRSIVEDIFTYDYGDEYLKSSAWEELFDFNKLQATKMIEDISLDTHPVILVAMINRVAAISANEILSYVGVDVVEKLITISSDKDVSVFDETVLLKELREKTNTIA